MCKERIKRLIGKLQWTHDQNHAGSKQPDGGGDDDGVDDMDAVAVLEDVDHLEDEWSLEEVDDGQETETWKPHGMEDMQLIRDEISIRLV